ncbi:sister chromatid cohesion protein DCC1 [Kwoniella heveanensis CBS 569]|nr:sister chromatid cohesion protein DCC1 [Kwoniella heveanensis CBS 569]
MLPTKNVVLRFPPVASNSSSESGSGSVSRGMDVADQAEETYQLLELPPEILKQVESLKGKEKEAGGGGVFPLTIKGRPSDDAVLCTPTTTFQLRTVGISNSLLVCRTSQSSSASSSSSSSSSKAKAKAKATPNSVTATSTDGNRPTLELRDTCHQILECVPIAANLERIRTVLRDSAWEGIGSEHSSLRKRKRGSAAQKGENGTRKGRTWTRKQLASVIQASEAELDRGLKDRNVVEVEGRMVLLPPKPLKELLVLLLSLLTIHHTSASTPNVASARIIIDALKDEHDVPPSLCRPVLNLFGKLTIDPEINMHVGEQSAAETEPEWQADAEAMVKQVGNGLLIGLKDRRSDEFVEEWKNEVGEMWADKVDLRLLEGEHLLTPPPATLSSFTSPSPLITHFPLSQLPLNPAQRFADLFLTRPRWRPEEIIPFLRGLTRDGDTKERDKLVQKFVRVVKEKDGTASWYPRRTG